MKCPEYVARRCSTHESTSSRSTHLRSKCEESKSLFDGFELRIFPEPVKCRLACHEVYPGRVILVCLLQQEQCLFALPQVRRDECLRKGRRSFRV